jgi:hypothetical protein
MPKENHRPAASHWQILSHNVVQSTPYLSGIRIHNELYEQLYIIMPSVCDPTSSVSRVILQWTPKSVSGQYII